MDYTYNRLAILKPPLIMQPIKKANDLFLESKPIFWEKVSFQTLFPEIQEIKWEVIESGYGIKNIKTHYIVMDNVREYINCSNPRCYGWWFPLWEVLRGIHKNKQEISEWWKLCIWYEGSPHGKKYRRTCINEFNYKITINYSLQ